MDFDLDKYDLFNAPQYVDFNQFLINDGFTNDNADKFFETHREEDDFFPAEITGATIIPTSLNGSDSQSSRTSSPPPSSAPTSQAENPTKPTVTAVPVLTKSEVHPHAANNEENIEEQVSVKLETAKGDKMKRILEIEAAERLKVKENLARAEQKYLLAEMKIETTTTVVTEVKNSIFTEGKPQVVEQCDSLVKPQQLPVHITEPLPVVVTPVDQPIQERKIKLEQKVKDELIPARKEVRAKSIQGKTNTPSVRRSRSLNTPKQPKVSEDIGKAGGGGDSSEKVQSESSNHMKTTLAAIPKKIPAKVTIPKPFKLSETRVRKLQIPDVEKDPFKFKAKPVPMKVLQGDVVTAVKPPPKVTQPLDFHFASDDRIRERNMKRSSVPNHSEDQDGAVKLKSGVGGSRSALGSACSSHEKMPSSENVWGSSSTVCAKQIRRPRSLSADRNRPTHVQPFSFEERDKELMRKKEEKIRKAIEDQAKIKEFHAQPLPDFNKAQKALPPKPLIPITTAKPFNLKCDQRGAAYQEELHRKLEEEQARLKQQAEFHAHPAAVVHRKPFVPEKSNAPLAEPINLHLNTDRRAEDRAKFDDMIRLKEAELERLRKQEQMLKEEQERNLTQALRKFRIHKAKPPPRSRVFEVKHSERPLTEPKSPAFAPLPSERRSRHVENKENVN